MLDEPIKFIAGTENNGSVTINSRETVQLKRDGKPLQAGDLIPGAVYMFDPETGELIEPKIDWNKK